MRIHTFVILLTLNDFVRRARHTMLTGTRSLWKGEDTGTQTTPGNIHSCSMSWIRSDEGLKVGGGNEINPHIKSPNRKPIHCVKEEIQGPRPTLKGCRKLFARVEWMRSACEFQVGWEKDVSRQTTSLTRPKSQPCARKSKWNFEQFEPDFGEKNLPLKKFHN